MGLYIAQNRWWMRRDREGWNSDAMDRLCSCRKNVGDQPTINTSVIAQKLGSFLQKKKINVTSGEKRRRRKKRRKSRSVWKVEKKKRALCGEGGRKCVDNRICSRRCELYKLYVWSTEYRDGREKDMDITYMYYMYVEKGS